MTPNDLVMEITLLKTKINQLKMTIAKAVEQIAKTVESLHAFQSQPMPLAMKLRLSPAQLPVQPTLPLSPPHHLIVKKGFKDLSNLAKSLTSLLSIREPHIKVLVIYGHKGSEEDIIFCKEPVETPTGPTMETPSLVLDSPSNNSMSELLLD